MNGTEDIDIHLRRFSLDTYILDVPMGTLYKILKNHEYFFETPCLPLLVILHQTMQLFNYLII